MIADSESRAVVRTVVGGQAEVVAVGYRVLKKEGEGRMRMAMPSEGGIGWIVVDGVAVVVDMQELAGAVGFNQ